MIHPQAIQDLYNTIKLPSLSIFLPDSLRRIKHGANVQYIKLGSGKNPNVRILDVVEFPTEESLSQTDWSPCYDSFLSFLAAVCNKLQEGNICRLCFFLCTIINTNFLSTMKLGMRRRLWFLPTSTSAKNQGKIREMFLILVTSQIINLKMIGDVLEPRKCYQCGDSTHGKTLGK